ncbi:TIM barrel protein [uncultured Paludibaculum sp.]|uniref:sugar phosphate isomerase/epimerase family protein n=1 Tax=uncultured Paludibaculum sp. TaxID=1765020 RepID=UPI002AAAEEFB|nr:TIM barrel protein [uncultured Paludibaculum sp.]
MTRRDILLSSLAAVPAPSGRKVRLGGPVFQKPEDPRELAREHRKLGYGAAYCPVVKSGDTARLRAIEAGFAAEDVVLAEVGVWVNLLEADAAKRKVNIQKVTDGLVVADETGTRCCVDIVGSYNPKYWDGPDPRNVTQACFDAAVENARAIIDAVKPKRAKFSYEMMGWTVPDSPDSYLKLIRAVDRKGFGVHIDVCNIISSPARFYNNAAVIRECFQKLGQWILSCHAKDLEWVKEMNLHFLEVVPGRGGIDYRAYLEAVAGLPQGAPLMLEHLKTAEEYAEGAAYIRKTGAAAGLSFA